MSMRFAKVFVIYNIVNCAQIWSFFMQLNMKYEMTVKKQS